MNILDAAIKAEGGVSALAKAIDVLPNVISNWRARDSVPPGYIKLLEIKYPTTTTRQPAEQEV